MFNVLQSKVEQMREPLIKNITDTKLGKTLVTSSDDTTLS